MHNAITLDELASIVKQGFDSVDQRFNAVDQRFDSMERRINARFDRLDHTILADHQHRIQRIEDALAIK